MRGRCCRPEGNAAEQSLAEGGFDAHGVLKCSCLSSFQANYRELDGREFLLQASGLEAVPVD